MNIYTLTDYNEIGRDNGTMGSRCIPYATGVDIVRIMAVGEEGRDSERRHISNPVFLCGEPVFLSSEMCRSRIDIYIMFVCLKSRLKTSASKKTTVAP